MSIAFVSVQIVCTEYRLRVLGSDDVCSLAAPLRMLSD
jgi:hypothetical protein